MRIFLSVMFALQLLPLSAQEDPTGNFPGDFTGVYKGDLKISTLGGENVVPMEFHLKRTDTAGIYDYVLVYGEGDMRQERDYLLVEKDVEKGLYVVDEQNGIVLNDRLVGNRLYSLFEVQGNILTTFMTFESDRILFEIVVAPRSEALTTYARSDSTQVFSYPVGTVQRALLIKQ